MSTPSRTGLQTRPHSREHCADGLVSSTVRGLTNKHVACQPQQGNKREGERTEARKKRKNGPQRFCVSVSGKKIWTSHLQSLPLNSEEGTWLERKIRRSTARDGNKSSFTLPSYLWRPVPNRSLCFHQTRKAQQQVLEKDRLLVEERKMNLSLARQCDDLKRKKECFFAPPPRPPPLHNQRPPSRPQNTSFFFLSERKSSSWHLSLAYLDVDQT